MYHIELYRNGARNYTTITGPTGPLVWVASCRKTLFRRLIALSLKEAILQDMYTSTKSCMNSHPLGSTFRWRSKSTVHSTSSRWP